MKFNAIEKIVLELSIEETKCLNQAYLILNDLFRKMIAGDYKAITDWDYTNIGAYDLDVASDLLKDLVEKDGLELRK